MDQPENGLIHASAIGIQPSLRWAEISDPNYLDVKPSFDYG